MNVSGIIDPDLVADFFDELDTREQRLFFHMLIEKGYIEKMQALRFILETLTADELAEFLGDFIAEVKDLLKSREQRK
ncbi:hypothetical protein [Campylobacter sp. MIT 97-5078]|uniref:hypothetical protein n=1 Tax=Campylobacter sp. MIT 97-5078 TaxID=1548153 RepID=UPI0005138219|nr:hypothetical protein [Campylobacter sp. MIT 97-5078]KGI55109.1 hypothetical protein LR59_13275 [Campylobacter sp. MIT 97-5078]KGI56824.1 hypothetical protein LR59_04915 [Campylobacter sp. MIT 97-5078]TQR25602.1 hypothetical protein DMB91_07305 [Campylobacter sp. MIT 97-5078]